jgi:hypothetical protein
MADITVTGQQAYFNEDAKFFKDVYVYGTLYYDFDFDTDNLVLDNITVNDTANINNLVLTGTTSVAGFSTFSGNVFLSGVTTAVSADIDNLVVGIATVQKRFELTNESGINYLVGFADGSRAGSIGIGSTLPDQKLDIGGAVRIQTNIFDSVNYPGANGYFLSRDSNGIRWVAPTPTQLQSIFVQNEGVSVGLAQSFSTLNFIGTRSGGDLVNASINPSNPQIVDIDIIDHWTKNVSGIHTTVNVGINIANPSSGLDVNALARFRQNVQIDGLITIYGSTFIDDGLIVTGFTTGTISTAVYANRSGFATYADIAGFSTNSQRAGFATFSDFAGISTFSDFAGISTFSVISGFSTNSQRAGFATFSDFAGISTYASIAGFVTFSNFAGISTFAIISGFATNSQRAGFATFSDFSGISTYASIAGFATNAQRAGFATFSDFAGVSTNIRTTSTSTNKDYFLTFVENSTSTGIETVRC